MSKLTYLPMFLSWNTMIGRRMPSVRRGSRGHVIKVELYHRNNINSCVIFYIVRTQLRFVSL